VDAIQRYYDANIPVDYWFRDMGKFKGSKTLNKTYNEVIKSVDNAYSDGTRICFAGQYGIGKTMICACILKRVVETGRYSALYVNLTDIVNLLTSQSSDKLEARKMLLSVDFLVVDEFDNRFMGTENAADLFGRMLEPVLRSRIQNQLPLFLCTNSPNVAASFTGSLRASIESLMKTVRIVPVLDKDHR
jgi:DNA replication protein DnaC